MIVAESMKRIIMLIKILSVRRGVSTSRIVVSLMIPQLVRVNRKFLKVRGLVREMLLPVWFVLSVENMGTRVMCVLLK